MFETIRQKLSRESDEHARREEAARPSAWVNKPDARAEWHTALARLELEEAELISALADAEGTHRGAVNLVGRLERLAAGEEYADLEREIALLERVLVEAASLADCGEEARKLAVLREFVNIKQERVDHFTARAKDKAATLPDAAKRVDDVRKQLVPLQSKIEAMRRKGAPL